MFLTKRDPDAPREILNWRLWYGVMVFGLMGAARGLDEGLVGTTISQKSFIKQFGLSSKTLTASQKADLQSNITSMVQIGSVGGALFAFYVTDKIGRLWATRLLCLLWTIGISIYLAAGSNGSIHLVYTGRFIAGLGVGMTTVVSPAYLAEIAPRFVRGLCVCAFSGSVYLGIVLGYFASWGSSLHISNSSPLQWVVPNLLPIYFAVIISILSLFAVESPRWLVKVSKHEKAMANLSLLRGLPQDHWYVKAEMMDITDQIERQQETIMGTKWYGAVRELVCLPSNQYRLMISIMSQLLGQWSGAQSITIYATQYFAILGTTGQNEKLFATAIFGVVKFASALICAFFLIDFIGRKRSLMTGITLQFIAMLYMAIFLAIDPSVGNGEIQSSSQKHAATGAIAMIYISGVGWSLGWNSLQYLISSEIYPLRLRALGSSITMTLHFLNQYGNTKAVPYMFNAMTVSGTLFFFSAITLIGLAWIWFFLPELCGKSLEAVDAVFELPWYLIGRRGQALTKDLGGAVDQVVSEKSMAVRQDAVETVEHAHRDKV